MICRSNPSISLDDIYNRVTEETLLSYYFNITKLPCVINSPLREDRNPSFAIFYRKNLSVGFYDFATKESGGIFDLLSKYFNLNFNQTLLKIYKDLDKISIPITTSIKNTHNKNTFHNVEIGVRVRSLQQHDIDYWGSYGISKEWLNFGRIYPISDIIITKNNNTFSIIADKYAYVYVEFKDGKQSLKIYQPFSKDYKWINNHDHSVWDLWQQLPKTNDKLIITSSRKDALCLWANLNIPACCLQAEGNIPKPHVIQQLIDRFKNIFVFYDNDKNKIQNTGQINAKKLADTYKLKNIKIEDEYDCKDPSDLYKKYGKQKFIEILKPKLCI